jgi:Lrp/AsnC family transcriptional regulator for asnA, asnC and gidA
MSMRLDNIDARILELLSQDGRMHYKELAKKINVSLPTVKERIRKLVDAGVIKKFTVVIDQERLWGRVQAFILAQFLSSDLEELITRIKDNEQIRTAYFVSGDKNVLLQIEADNLKDLNQFISKNLQSELGLSNPVSLLITQTLKEEYGGNVKPNTILKFECDFCKVPVYGKPIIEYINGVRYYFSSPECAQAFKEINLRKA